MTARSLFGFIKRIDKKLSNTKNAGLLHRTLAQSSWGLVLFPAIKFGYTTLESAYVQNFRIFLNILSFALGYV